MTGNSDTPNVIVRAERDGAAVLERLAAVDVSTRVDGRTRSANADAKNGGMTTSERQQPSLSV